MIEKVIDRDAGDKSKGFRLQKLRAMSLALDAIEKTESAHIYFAIEHLEDVYIKKVDSGEVEEYFEQDKNFDSVGTFTFNSHQVLNTLVSFLDCWISKRFSQNVFFGFYTTVNIGKEKTTEQIKKICLKLPLKPIIELLVDRKYEEENLIEITSALIIAEYEKQYEGKSYDGNLQIIKNFSSERWKQFFDCIRWKFDEADEDGLKKELINKIQLSRYYSRCMGGNENLVIAGVLDLLDERQKNEDVTEKFVYASDIKLIFKQVETYDFKRPDPAYALWDELPPVTDKRPLKEKIESVCPQYNPDKIASYARKVTNTRLEFKTLANDKNLISLKYQIFDVCYDELIDLKSSQLSSDEIDLRLDQLFAVAKQHIKDKSKDYVYTLKSDAAIRNIILELFDSCYLAFDKGEVI